VSRIPSDQKTHKLARRALIRAKESARISHMLPDDIAVRLPKRDRKAWHRLGLRAVIMLASLLTIPPAMARGGGHGGNHGHHAGSGHGGSATSAFHAHMTGG
jgi:hypothetical protein